MPNLVPPVTTVEHALSYRSRLQNIEPNVQFLMSLYLHPSITPETIREAKKAGITGVKSYPAGVGRLSSMFSLLVLLIITTSSLFFSTRISFL